MVEKTKRSTRWVKKSNRQKYAGIHLIVEFWNGKIIENQAELKKILWRAAKAANNTPLEFVVHKFQPQGITGVVLLAESHIAYHSWPEFHYAAIDIYTCGEKASPRKAIECLKKELRPRKIEIREFKRGKINLFKCPRKI